MLRSEERNIRITAKRAGREQVVHSLPDASFFPHICLSHALKSAIGGPSWYQSAILGLIHIIMQLSAIFLPLKINKLHGLRVHSSPHASKISGSLCSVPLILQIMQTVFGLDSYRLIFPLIAQLGNVRREVFFLSFPLFVFLLSILFNWECKMKALPVWCNAACSI